VASETKEGQETDNKVDLVWTELHQYQVANAVINMGSGVVAGMTATILTQPFDMLKTRMQLKPTIYKNLLQAATKVLKVSKSENQQYDCMLNNMTF
jgi:solute carrier family 25 protein 38